MIGVSLFFINFRIDSNLFIELREAPKTKLVIVLFKDLKELYRDLKRKIEARNMKIVLTINRKRKNIP